MKKKIRSRSFCCVLMIWGILSTPVLAADDLTGKEQVSPEVKERLQNEYPEDKKIFRYEHRRRIAAATQEQGKEPNVASNNRQLNKGCCWKMKKDRTLSTQMLRRHSGRGSATSRKSCSFGWCR
ncbi:MAG: hypothetical protein SWO11_08740 [Thermodesulfobacteriota bacterium]|nr:hypothetical protein [Thermodesulfobacteriota bacterium]